MPTSWQCWAKKWEGNVNQSAHHVQKWEKVVNHGKKWERFANRGLIMITEWLIMGKGGKKLLIVGLHGDFAGHGT
jgi:hypothetical protein